MKGNEMKSNSVKSVAMRRTVLDLGAYNGCASSSFAGSGDRWILVDNRQWVKYDWGEPVIPERAEYVISDIMDYHEPAEIVVCFDVLYHIEDPHAFLHHLRRLTLETLYLRTYYDEGDKGWNYYGKEKPAHPHPSTAETIYWRPTLPALIDELGEVGFKNVKIIKNSAPKSMLVTIECS